MTAYAPSYPSTNSSSSSVRGSMNGKASTTIKMPAAFKAIQQPIIKTDPLDSIDSFSFVFAKSNDTSDSAEPLAQPEDSPEQSVTLRSPSTFTRPVHRAKSTPSLSNGSGKLTYNSASLTTPSRPGTPGKRMPFPWGLRDNRFSNASSLTTNTNSTSDRSSSGSFFNPKFFKRGSGSESPSLSIHNTLVLDSQSQNLPIEIIDGYADDLNQPAPAAPSSTEVGATVSNPHSSTIKSKATSASRPSIESSSDTPPRKPFPPQSSKTTKSSSRDRYGFKKQTQFITEAQYDEWWAGYEPHLQRRKKKWVSFMKESGLSIENDQPVRFPAKSEKLKRYIRKGIPAEWRGNAWFFYAKGHEKLSNNKGLYDKLCGQTENLKNLDTELIERDLHRTFPDNIHFRSDTATDGERSRETEPVLIKSLRRVLTTFSVYQPKIGYCQSLNFLAGLLLLFMDEEQAFWMLVIITQRYLPGVHDMTLEGVNIDQGVLMLCVRESLPKLWDKIGVNFDGQHYNTILSKLPPITLCTAAWFMSGYIGILPIETVLRVWDCFFFEESKTFFRIALTIFKLAEPELEHLDDPMEIFQVIQTIPKRLIDASALLSACFKRRNGFGHISQEEIRRLREFVRERRLQANLAALEETNGSNNDASPSDSSTHHHHHHHRYGGNRPTKKYSANDLREFNNFKHAPRPLHVQLSRRMRSLKLSSSRGSGQQT